LRVSREIDNARRKENEEEGKKEDDTEEGCDEVEDLWDAPRELGGVTNLARV
jgi:hypothetical protein